MVGIDSMISASAAIASAVETRKKEREYARNELAAMSEAMVREQGLLNYAQAALVLDVSVKRVWELVKLGKLTRYDFLGRTYVSMREVRERDREALKAGRPKRGIVRRVVGSLKAGAKTDALQAKQGGFAGPYERSKAAKQGVKKKA